MLGLLSTVADPLESPKERSLHLIFSLFVGSFRLISWLVTGCGSSYNHEITRMKLNDTKTVSGCQGVKIGLAIGNRKSAIL
jgi:hypothetical protein